MTKKPYPIIGLEIHIELNTKSKMFCQCAADYFGKAPNTHTCPVCLGLPGALPVPNHQAIERTIKIAQALNCLSVDGSKPLESHFDRKHYFYPDLPKGYQISQFSQPIGQKGYLEVTFDDKTTKRFHIRQVHLEEDTGKLIHQGEDSIIDYNRSSVPLVEIVTEADFHSSEDVKRFLEELQVLIRTLGVANADMEKGDMRLEPNISVYLLEEGTEWDKKTFPPYKVEVKNINSFRFAKAAIDTELKRHIEILETGEFPIQETRGFVEATMGTKSQRVKENAMDYRYFAEPDVPPFTFSVEQLEAIRKTMPELPNARLNRFMSEYGIKFADAMQLTRTRTMADLFEEVVSEVSKQASGSTDKKASQKSDLGQKVANFLINKMKVADGSDSLTAKEVVKKYLENAAPKQTDTALLEKVITDVLSSNEKAVAEYKSGKESVIMFMVGQVMKGMKGQADASVVKEALVKKLQ